jgi:hypothetical protein
MTPRAVLALHRDFAMSRVRTAAKYSNQANHDGLSEPSIDRQLRLDDVS